MKNNFIAHLNYLTTYTGRKINNAPLPTASHINRLDRMHVLKDAAENKLQFVVASFIILQVFAFKFQPYSSYWLTLRSQCDIEPNKQMLMKRLTFLTSPWFLCIRTCFAFFF